MAPSFDRIRSGADATPARRRAARRDLFFSNTADLRISGALVVRSGRVRPTRGAVPMADARLPAVGRVSAIGRAPNPRRGVTLRLVDAMRDAAPTVSTSSTSSRRGAPFAPARRRR